MGGDSTNRRLDYVLAGGTSGMIARTCIAPIERIKILFQIQKGSSSYVKLLTDVLKKEGIKSMWKGNSAAVIRVIPYTSIQFSSFEEYSTVLRKFESLPKTPRDLTAGSLAGLTACATTYPLDVVRARMALQNEGLANTRYTGVGNALVTIARKEGLRTLYRGMTATMGGVAPYTGLKFAAYAQAKYLLSKFLGLEEKDMPTMGRAFSGAMAGTIALTFVYPFDVVRRRFQTHSGAQPYADSVFGAFRTILREEGIARGLYRGLTLNYIKTIPNVAIYMSVYDILKKQLDAFNAK